MENATVPSPTFETAVRDLQLRTLLPGHARDFLKLISENRAHLTRFGNYEDLVALTLADLEAQLADAPEGQIRVGVWVRNQLAGRVDLNPVRPGVLVLGYWLALSFTGRGYATEACRSVLDLGRTTLGAREVWAGVTHGNQKSIAVLLRLGFRAVETLPDRTRFRLALAE